MKAIQWYGNLEEVKEFCKPLKVVFDEARYKKEMAASLAEGNASSNPHKPITEYQLLKDEHDKTVASVPQGSWIIKDEGGNVKIMSDGEFRAMYVKDENTYTEK